VGGRYAGIDLHRRGSVIYTMDADGERLECVRIANDALTLLDEVSKAGPDVEIVIEATYGWYWIVDWLQKQGATVRASSATTPTSHRPTYRNRFCSRSRARRVTP
jgi:hypothetical protein